MNRLSFLLLMLTGCCWSCERNIDISAGKAETLVVIEGVIEEGEYPVISVTNSLGLFASISPELLSEIFIHDAEVVISNGNSSMQLKEYSIPTGPGYTFSFYSADTLAASDLFKGEVNTTYHLSVKANGKEYTAQTTIPESGITIKDAFAESANLEDEQKMRLMVTLADKPGYGNYHRYFTKTNNEPFYPGLYSAGNDQIIDGVTVTIQLDKGVDKNGEIDFDTYPYFDKGDSVIIKISEIDLDTYNFWRTLEFSYASTGNPFSSPVKIIGNIQGGALGYFGGYNPQFYSIKIPD